MQLTHWIAPLFFAWALGLILVLLRKSIPLFWKVSATLVFCFYGAWYAPELSGSGLAGWLDDPLKRIPFFLAALIRILPLILLFAWPFVLIFASRERTAESAVHHLRTLTLLTLFYWLFWLGATATGKDLSPGGLQESMQNLLPADIDFSKFSIGEFPEPPAGP